MSLTGALNVGRTAMAVTQAALQVTGNNIANAGNADYTRQTATVTPNKDQQIQTGVFIGNGIKLEDVSRQIDEALQGRLRGSFSDSESADTLQQWLGRVESTFNELGDDDLSTRLSTFFNSWSTLANTPQDAGARQVVLQNGDAVANWFHDLRGQLSNLQSDVGERLKAQASDADGLAQQIADLNAQIVTAEGGTGGTANGLRDERDAVLGKLSQLMDVRTIPQDNGSVNVYVGSEPLVIAAQNRGVTTKQTTVNGQVSTEVVFKATNGTMPVKSGQIGGLVQAREKIDGVVTQIDDQAKNLIFELNKLHASGQGLQGFSTVTSTNSLDDATVALNKPASGIDFTPQTGSFVVHVKQKATGLETSTLVNVDLDGLNGNDTTLNSLATDLNNINGMSASVNGGKLAIAADSSAVEISFSQDTSGTLAALGVNNFYTGSSALDIAVNQTVKDNPQLLAAAKNGQPADNQTARAIASLESTKLASLDGQTMKDKYQTTVNELATASDSAKTSAEAASAVKDTLTAQREALSGVSLDEEAVNLMRQQRAFQGAARLISAVDELMQTVLNMT
jgi:flagellar hook-associated protein 1 FlgK